MSDGNINNIYHNGYNNKAIDPSYTTQYDPTGEHKRRTFEKFHFMGLFGGDKDIYTQYY